MKEKDKLKHYRISQKEYERIQEILGRKPEGVEWALFSALWSEHCSYKSSKKHLRKFNFRSPKVLESFGENAGVIDLGEGEKVSFKMESHNHPSFIEPFQGAATGVGGILRDIFAMGARPIALANYLCFGDLKAPRMKSLLEGVVSGISFYGNCVGVPMLEGQTQFHPCYNENILVNALALGLFSPEDKVFTSGSFSPGCLVIYVGAKTGRDGIHGASMASESFKEDTKDKTTVQIGDPFFEKLLIESCLEVMSKNLVEAVQDMGAAGLTSSSFEMSSKAGHGLKIHLDKVPLRDKTLSPEDILLSESQERMLFMVKPQNEKKVHEIFKRWDLDSVCIGEVVEDKKIHLFWKKEEIFSMDPKKITEEAPEYDRDHEVLKSKKRTSFIEKVKNPREKLLEILKSEQGATRKWIYEQYDQRVGGRTCRDLEETVGVLRLPHSGRALGMALGGRSPFMNFDAFEGGRDSLFYPCLQLASKGFEPVGATDCLNFGNPEKKKVMSEFVATVNALSELSKTLEIPIVSGNVSFYNETLGKDIISTPGIGVVGLRSDEKKIPFSFFKEKNDIYLLQYEGLRVSGFFEENIKGFGELQNEDLKEFFSWILGSSFLKGVSSTRTVGGFGLAYTLAIMCKKGVGANVDSFSLDPFTCGLYEVIFCVEESLSSSFKKQCEELKPQKPSFQISRIGKTQKDRLILQSNENMTWDVKEIQESYLSRENGF